MSAKVDKQTPAWVLDVVDETLSVGTQNLMDRMLERGEDITDTPLWIHRRSQFLSLLTAKAQQR